MRQDPYGLFGGEGRTVHLRTLRDRNDHGRILREQIDLPEGGGDRQTAYRHRIWCSGSFESQPNIDDVFRNRASEELAKSSWFEAPTAVELTSRARILPHDRREAAP